MKDQAGPVHGGVGMVKIIPRKKDIRDVRDDFIAIITTDFKDSV